MGYLTAGINHKTAPVALREQVAFSPEQLPEALQDARHFMHTNEVAILSTCNRTELYCASNADYHKALEWLTGYHNLDQKLLSQHSYIHHDKAAVRHMMRVACGLDSMVLGEPQILGQLKSAYAQAQEAGTIGSLLSRLFQYCFTTAKQVRTNTAIGRQPVSIAYAATTLAQRIFADLSENTALLIGAGETIELVARHLHQQGLKDIIVANRTMGRAKLLADKFNGKPALLSDIPHLLPAADIVVSSTASPVPVLGKGTVERAIKKRKHRPIFMVDIAVPRDIEPEVTELPDIYLYTVDDLHGVIQDNMQQRQNAAKEAELLIETGAFEFMSRLRSLDAVSVLRSYRQNTEALRDRELEKAILSLANGIPAEQVLNQFARSLTNKLMHTPSVALKKAAAQGQSNQLEWAEELLGIHRRYEDPDKGPSHS
ncbi:glutamyl-tRNA reductase [Endozoicomonas sp. 4G]|uniref:glutamyl-tRNA reductase n=1 Tax=Endozoicomonas sp. 4G TaxID=2872754 RepID=UPI002078CE76|nr:glutamyl-tRNA reductase [Endozoicomonas sp. 4G]